MTKKIAILIDGGYFLKRLPKLVDGKFCSTPQAIVACIRRLCREHIKQTVRMSTEERWHDHVYRIFFYDSEPYDGTSQHPIDKKHLDFGKSDLAVQRHHIFELLKKQKKVALRLGHVIKDGDWSVMGAHSRKIIPTKTFLDKLDLEFDDQGKLSLTEEQRSELARLKSVWGKIQSYDIRLGLKQKGVDMRIGLDIASITLKRQAETIILVAGDSDFVPAAKLARREGMEFILDPLWQAVNHGLYEHIDGLQSGLPNPNRNNAAIIETATNNADKEQN